ncbi:hypothetical protein [Billgrantia aerodenitrificans]|uniref:Uncharacterized protein n=1 Tax=Billgrantia aerodenitrificans TaxID=2733483 RepID=A0ABS9ARI5_9GAMM|nr:hypothetical protein [Halomonas aerodenitrificans]MCE8024346.1 hypothetical protein [Halomonas aerodenitrificans]
MQAPLVVASTIDDINHFYVNLSFLSIVMASYGVPTQALHITSVGAAPA